MITKRIIPCLDIKEGRVVKGVSFTHLKDAGDPVELAALYDRLGADELVMLDISASIEGRKMSLNVIQQVSENLTIPLTVGGGIQTVEDMAEVFLAGADKISMNTAAVMDPSLIEKGAKKFGDTRMVVAVDAKYDSQANDWYVYTHGGQRITEWRVLDWAKEAVNRGAGEILLTSIDQDGQKNGFDLSLIDLISREINVPVIASGGAGEVNHFVELFTQTKASAALAASIFHYGQVSISEVKECLKRNGVMIR